MKKDQIIQVVKNYDEVLRRLGHTPKIASLTELAGDSTEQLNHILHMGKDILQFVEDDRYGKVNRWLGFQQGVLWSNRILPIMTMMEHNRPKGSIFSLDK